jgi:hypothetical protein
MASLNGELKSAENEIIALLAVSEFTAMTESLLLYLFRFFRFAIFDRVIITSLYFGYSIA